MARKRRVPWYRDPDYVPVDQFKAIYEAAAKQYPWTQDEGFEPYLIDADRFLPSAKKRKAMGQARLGVERGRAIFRSLTSLVQLYGTLIEGIVVEAPHGSQHSRSARASGLSDGLLAALVEETGLPFEVYDYSDCLKGCLGVSTVRKVVVGTISRGPRAGEPKMGTQKKERIAASVCRRFVFDEDLMPKIPQRHREHVYDAASVLVAARHGNLVRRLAWPASAFEEQSAVAQR